MMFNSALVCELGLLKRYAIPILNRVPETIPEYTEAIKLKKILDYFESIDDNAFMYCSGLKTIRLSEGLSSIGKYAFEGCRELQSVYIPASVKEIGAGVLSENSAMTTITVAPGNISPTTLERTATQ